MRDRMFSGDETGAAVADPHEDQAMNAAPAPDESSSTNSAPANDNWPVVELVPAGDGTALARALVRVLVRRALISEGAFSVGGGCDDQQRAG